MEYGMQILHSKILLVRAESALNIRESIEQQTSNIFSVTQSYSSIKSRRRNVYLCLRQHNQVSSVEALLKLKQDLLYIA